MKVRISLIAVVVLVALGALSSLNMNNQPSAHFRSPLQSLDEPKPTDAFV